MAKLLSVCIPTFSNPAGVEATLQNLISQAKKHGAVEKVEFCVADNSEDEATGAVIARIKTAEDIPIAYRRHGQNLGYDRNVDAVIKLAGGEYCWLLSDNEIAAQNALAEILSALEADQTTAVFVICSEDIPEANLRTYADMEAAMTENGLWVPGGLVSRNVIKRALIPADLSPYFDNDWLHLSVTFAVAANSPVTFLSEKFIYDPNETSRWAKDGKTFITYTNLLHIFADLPRPPYSDEFVERITRKMRRGLPKNILSSKLYGLRVSPATARRLRRAVAGRPLWLMLCTGALMIPTALLRHGKKCKNSFGH